MNNRYLYRAKRCDNGEWVEGFYFCMEHTDKRHVHHFIIPLGASLEKGTPIEDIQVEVDESTICNRTSKSDANDVIIYEHDYVKYEEEVYEVTWSDCNEMFELSQFGCSMYALGDIDTGEITVICSATDNPELLEVR